MNQFAPQVIETVAANRFCTIVGETGSGKTTQVPQILLNQAIDDGMGSAVNIICTQPRRIAASSVARRVAAERGQELGQTVGYHIRHDAALPKYGGSITYCTTGILLKQLQSPDEVMDSVSHIILDEVHERDINLDFCLIMIKRSFIERARLGKSIPKLILMSATVDTAIFEKYFADSRLGTFAGPCPALRIPGRIFPVQRYYLTDIMNTLQESEQTEIQRDKWIQSELSFKAGEEDERSGFPSITFFSKIIAHAVKSTNSGAILIFMPGLGEIQKLNRSLVEEQPLGIDFGDKAKFRLYQLHSLIEQDQRTVFEESEPGVRKIILSTNIAETSVTIPDVTVVIDSGRIRRMEYDSTRRISELRTIYVSQSNLNQRAGRAGRVQAGVYYGLFHQDRIRTLAPLPVPEMRLSDLAEMGLTIRAQQNPVPIATFLADAIEPPPREAVDAAVRDLTALGAIANDQVITNLGWVLARLPLHPALGKMVILGILFKCLDPIIILGLAVESNVWGHGDLETERAANAMRLRFTEGTLSEHLALLHAYRDLRNAVRQKPNLDKDGWCRQHFLRHVAMRHIDQGARQVEQVLAESGLIPSLGAYGNQRKNQANFSGIFGPPHLNTNSHNEPLVRAALAAGLQPNMAWGSFANSGRLRNFSTPHAEKLEYSVNWEKMLPIRAKPLKPTMPLILFDKSVWTDMSKTTCFSTMTPISPLIAALFGDQPRNPSAQDKAWMSRNSDSQDPGNLVLGRANPMHSEEETRRLVMMVSSTTKEEASEDDTPEARDALLQFRIGMDRALERVLRNLAQGRAVDEDPEWTVYVDGLVRLVGADDWDGLERAMGIIEDMKGKESQKRQRRGPSTYRRISLDQDEPRASRVTSKADDGSNEDRDESLEGDSDGDSHRGRARA